MTDQLWGPIDLTRWRDVPFVSGRVATEGDVEAGRAVFYIDGEAEAVGAPAALPALALHTDESGTIAKVVVIQLERSDGGEVAGVRFLAGGNMVCTLAELRFVDETTLRSLL